MKMTSGRVVRPLRLAACGLEGGNLQVVLSAVFDAMRSGLRLEGMAEDGHGGYGGSLRVEVPAGEVAVKVKFRPSQSRGVLA